MRHLRLAPGALLALLALLSCGDNRPAPDARPGRDTGTDEPPPAPRLGTQIDRMGRPAINTVLIGLRDAMDTAAMKQDAYNMADDPSQWIMAPIANGRSIEAEFEANLGIVDVLDQGNPTIPGTPGCRNQVLYNSNPSGGGTPSATSYQTFADILADDMVYLDTNTAPENPMGCSVGRTDRPGYLALELHMARGEPSPECGGRAPSMDVIDATYSALFAGLDGFTGPPGSQPRISDGVLAHPDVSDTAFPYFGPPH